MHKLLLAGSATLALLAIPATLQAQSTAGQEAVGDTASTSTPQGNPQTTASPTPANNPVARALGGNGGNRENGGSDALEPAQKATYDSWSAQQKSDYASWPSDYKTYYWTLNADQQRGYWRLTADQRGQIYRMTPEQRQIAWNSVVQQMSGQTPSTPPGQANPPGEGMPTTGVPDPQSAGQAVRPAMPADQSYQGGPYKGALTPPPATATDKSYPRCSKTVTDNCRNRGGV